MSADMRRARRRKDERTMDDNEQCINGKVELYRRQGHWQMIVYAPKWVIADIFDEIMAGGELKMANNCYASDSAIASMLLVIVDKQPPTLAPDGPQ